MACAVRYQRKEVAFDGEAEGPPARPSGRRPAKDGRRLEEEAGEGKGEGGKANEFKEIVKKRVDPSCWSQ